MNDVNLLFVYGTLLQGIQSNIAQYFHANSSFLSEGYMQGQLYDLGMYPGAVFNSESEYKVYGHIFQLKNPISVLKILDEYEGCSPERKQPTEYLRKQIPIFMENKKIDCWVYVYNFSVEKKVQIESGNYFQYLKGNERHLGFIDSV